jgi:hypothetical protein
LEQPRIETTIYLAINQRLKKKLTDFTVDPKLNHQYLKRLKIEDACAKNY